jgi:hypothetical protein
MLSVVFISSFFLSSLYLCPLFYSFFPLFFLHRLSQIYFLVISKFASIFCLIIPDKGDTYIPTNDKKTSNKNHQPQHDSSTQYVWESHNMAAKGASPLTTPTNPIATNLQKSDIFSSHNQLLKSPMEENQHHSDMKYFDFLHYTNDNDNDAKLGLFVAAEKTASKHTSNGGGGVGGGHVFNDRYDDDDDDDKDIDEMDAGCEAVYGRKLQQATNQRMGGYDEPEYAMVDLKKKSDDRLKTNGLVTGGSNIMGENWIWNFEEEGIL